MPPSLAMELIQSAHRLANGELWLPTQTAQIEIPICRVEDIATIGMSHLDVFGGNGRGAFDMETGCTDSDDHKCQVKKNNRFRPRPGRFDFLIEPDLTRKP